MKPFEKFFLHQKLKMIAPSEFTSDIKITNLDLQKAVEKFTSDSKYFIAMGVLKHENKTFQTVLNSEVFTNGLISTEFSGKVNYSLGLAVSEEDVKGLEILKDVLISFLNDQSYEITNPVKDEKLYLKLKSNFKNNGFNITSNVKMNPTKFQETGIFRGQQVQVVCDFSVYVNVKEKKAGVVITPRKLTFEI